MKRRRNARPGELRLTYGPESRRSAPDAIIAWGAGVPKADSHMLFARLFPLGGGRNLVEELEARGYDLSTLVFSVHKRTADNEPVRRIEGE